MMNQERYPSAARNAAVWDTSASFEPQLPLGYQTGTGPFSTSEETVPPGVVLLEAENSS